MMLGMVALLGVAGLAIDISNMFYAKVQLQKSADAAVLAGLEYRLEHGPLQDDSRNPQVQRDEFTKTSTDVKNRAEEITKYNLALNLKSLNRDKALDKAVTTAATYDVLSASPYDKESLSVDVSAQIKFFLLGFVPLEMLNAGTLPKLANINANSTGEIKPGRIVLMVDFSTSMSCPFQSDLEEPLPFIPSDADDVTSLYKYLDSKGIAFPEITTPQGPDPVKREAYASLIRTYTYCSCLIEKFYNPFPDNTLTKPFEYVNPQSPCNPLASDSKLTNLITSIHEFLKFFKTNRDIISIIPFNLSSTVFKSLKTKYIASDLTYWNPTSGGIINAIQSGSDARIKLGEWTNPSDALVAAFQDNNYSQTGNVAGATPTRDTHYILFTDGAPTAGRFSFTNSSAATNAALQTHSYLDNNSSIQTVNGLSTTPINDNIIFSIANPARAVRIPDANDPTQVAYGIRTQIWSISKLYAPMPFSVDGSNLFYGLNYSSLGAIAKRREVCSDRTTPAGLISDGSIENYCGCFNNVLNKDTCSRVFNYKNFPTANTIRYQNATEPIVGEYAYADLTPAGSTSLSLENSYIKDFYNITISYADHIRANKGIIYTIGLGPTASSPTIDPQYQDYTNPYTRKDYFMSRVAFAKYSEYRANFGNLSSWTDLENSAVSDRNGFYLPAADPKDVQEAFRWLAKYLSRITQ